MKEKIEKIRQEIYKLFKEDTGKRKYSYVRRDWIFPNHLDIMVDLVKDMCKKYRGNETICILAVLLHDVGLIYKREIASPKGHEKRSIEFARNLLEKYDIPTKEEIIKCIKATDSSETPESINARIVRTSDALSQFISVHFFAKAAFSGDWEFYKDWLKKKATNNFNKICFEEERKLVEPVRKYILNALNLHDKYNAKYPLDLNLKKESEDGRK